MSDDSYEIGGSRCPSCQTRLKQGAVLCVECGYHLEKKTHLTTARKLEQTDEGHPEQANKKKKKKKKRSKKKKYFLGILHGGNAMVLCTLAGFMLAVLLALVLGTIFAAGNELFFELSIYVFFGALTGIGIGGGVGYVLASVLPNHSSEDVSVQLQGGLFSVIGGFVLTGIGLLSFALINGGGRGGPNFKIAIAVNELLGKWGVLVVICGAGLALIGYGIWIMIPRDT